METKSEIEVMGEIDKLLSPHDQETRDRILLWVGAKFPSKVNANSVQQTSQSEPQKTRTKSKTQNNKPKVLPKINPDLNLHPQGKKTFIDFVNEKTPRSDQEKCVVSVFYIKQLLDIEQVTLSDVFTCYKELSWELPSDFSKTLHTIASQKGWLITKDLQDIQLTTRGLNLVNIVLPKNGKDK